MAIRPADLIERKRNGEELGAEELSELILAYSRDEVPDYQMAAWCMAVYFRGMTGAETFALTDAMIRSGAAEEARRAAEAGASRTVRAALGFEQLLADHDGAPSPDSVEAIFRRTMAGQGHRAIASSSSARS